MYLECKENYEENIDNRTDHPELYYHVDEGIDINKYLKYIENELTIDKIVVNEDLLMKIINMVRDFDVDDY